MRCVYGIVDSLFVLLDIEMDFGNELEIERVCLIEISQFIGYLWECIILFYLYEGILFSVF